MALSARFSHQFSFSTVPVTGQTFAVLLIGALYGSRLGAATMIAYLAEGAAGMPVFSNGLGGISAIATASGGYIFGFILAAYVVGWFAERGWDRSRGIVFPMLLANAVHLRARPHLAPPAVLRRRHAHRLGYHARLRPLALHRRRPREARGRIARRPGWLDRHREAAPPLARRPDRPAASVPFIHRSSRRKFYTTGSSKEGSCANKVQSSSRWTAQSSLKPRCRTRPRWPKRCARISCSSPPGKAPTAPSARRSPPSPSISRSTRTNTSPLTSTASASDTATSRHARHRPRR